LEIESLELAKILSLKKLKEVRRSYEMFKPGELKKIVSFIQTLPDNISNYLMYKTFILILIDTGARVGEVLAIEKKEIDLKNCEILLKKTKTKIERLVYFYSDTGLCINEMMKLQNKSKYLLWNNDKQRPMNYDDVRYVMKLLEEKCKIKNIYPYMFRHTFATNLIENGADVFAVKELMGHEKLTTTQIYTHLSKKHIKKVFQTSHKR
jgi:integrase/recombinase XerC